MCFIITQAACRPLISGPVYSCYSSPCRWNKRASPFHSRVCSWSVGWQSTWGGKPESIKPREPWGPQILSCVKEGTASCSRSYGRGYDYCRTSCSATGCRMPFFPGLGDLVSRLPKATLYSTTLLRCSSVSVAANCPSWHSLKVILMEQETGTARADQLLP